MRRQGPVIWPIAEQGSGRVYDKLNIGLQIGMRTDRHLPAGFHDGFISWRTRRHTLLRCCLPQARRNPPDSKAYPDNITVPTAKRRRQRHAAIEIEIDRVAIRRARRHAHESPHGSLPRPR